MREKAKTLKTNCGSYALGGLRKRRAANDRDEPERRGARLLPICRTEPRIAAR